MELGRRDLDALQRALLDLHEERELDAFREAVPGIFMGAIRATYFRWVESSATDGDAPIRNLVTWDHPARMTPRLTRRILAMGSEHPFTIHGTRTGDWSPMRLSDFWSTRQLVASALWRDVYRELGIGRLLACSAFRGNRVGALQLARPLEDRDFSQRDCLVLELLMPHFVQALRAAELATARRDMESQVLPSLGLTPREAEIAVWLSRGRTNPEIATILAMRPRTVEKHVERILAKLGVENRTAAAMMIAGAATMRSTPSPAPIAVKALTRRRA